MNARERALLLVHGAALLFLGLLLGLAAVAEELTGAPIPRWRAGHGALLLAGVWLLAVVGVWDLLALSQTQKTALCRSLLMTVYAFSIAIVVQAGTGTRMLDPGHSPAGWIGFIANIVTVAAGFFASLLTLLDVLAARRQT